MMISPALRLWACRAGSSAVEFALVVPVLFTMLIGTIYSGLVIYSAVGLQTAVEAGARCYALGVQCTTGATAQNVSLAAYHGLSTPVFTASTPACGHQVSATLTLSLSSGLTAMSIPLSARACTP